MREGRSHASLPPRRRRFVCDEGGDRFFSEREGRKKGRCSRRRCEGEKKRHSWDAIAAEPPIPYLSWLIPFPSVSSFFLRQVWGEQGYLGKYREFRQFGTFLKRDYVPHLLAKKLFSKWRQTPTLGWSGCIVQSSQFEICKATKILHPFYIHSIIWWKLGCITMCTHPNLPK